jgi:hypothetical protein
MTLIVEGISEGACFAALDRHIADLATERTRFSQACELGHRALELGTVSADDTARAVFEDLVSSILLVALDTGWFGDTPTSFVAAEFKDRFIEVLPAASQAHGLPTWCTNTFAGLPAPTWTSRGNAGGGPTPTAAGWDVSPACCESPRIIVRISAGSKWLLTDVLNAIQRFLDFLHGMVRLLDHAIEAACVIRLIVRSGLRHRPNALAFVLIILATCRHYGHRSEPDDHASLLNRRHPVIRGSCPQT